MKNPLLSTGTWKMRPVEILSAPDTFGRRSLIDAMN